MFCTKCGALNDDDDASCIRCGAPVTGAADPRYAPPTAPPAPAEKIPNYLVQSILVTLCCCLPAGIVAIVYAAQVNGKIQMGDLDGARQYSRQANIWSWVAFGVGATINLIYFGVTIFGSFLGNR